jgi:pimeloyl-ACP methyl ester carboxylesterase
MRQLPDRHLSYDLETTTARHQFDTPMRHSKALLVLLVFVCSCTGKSEQSAIDRLHPCSSDEAPIDAYCGTMSVFENRDTKQGRKIDLRIVVLPALSSDFKPDPVFFLAGGPGQGAAELARPLRELFRRIQTDRDIVLVDQRGTGKSNPLNCRSQSESLKEINEPDQTGLDRLRRCMEQYDADLRLYTTSIAMDDLDDVRAYLGYDKINVYGGSYGTRAALVYLRQHEPHVRAMIIDGVAPPDMRLPLFFARDAQRAFDLLVADCAKDEECNTLYPNLADRTRALIARLEKAPVRTRLVHPRTGIAEDVTVNAGLVTGTIFGALYSPLAASLVPALIERAQHGDFQGMLALALSGEAAGDNMSLGMQLSVICAEDAPRIKPEEAEHETSNTIFGKNLLATRMKACEFWPKGKVPADYYAPVQSQVPTLVLSGELDPVTPPSWGAQVAKTLPNSRHLIAPGTGHGVITRGCGIRIMKNFIDSGTVQGLDDSCLRVLKRPPFFLTPAGPNPTRIGVAQS